MNSEDIALELFSLLDNIDTLDDVCRDDDRLFRELVRREAAKRFDYATTDGYSVELKTGVDDCICGWYCRGDCSYKAGKCPLYHRETMGCPIRDVDPAPEPEEYKPQYVYTYTDKSGNIIILKEVSGDD